MPKDDDISAAIVGKRVAADFELHPARLLQSAACMAIVTVLVVLGRAHLTREVRSMRRVIRILARDIVTVTARRTIAHGISVGIGRTIAVHFVRAVAGGALHGVRDIVNVGAESVVSTLIFISDTTAMTRCALIGHVRCATNQVTLHESAAHRFGPAYVAFAAGRVTLVALLLKFLMNGPVRFNLTSCTRLKHRVIALHR